MRADARGEGRVGARGCGTWQESTEVAQAAQAWGVKGVAERRGCEEIIILLCSPCLFDTV